MRRQCGVGRWWVKAYREVRTAGHKTRSGFYFRNLVSILGNGKNFPYIPFMATNTDNIIDRLGGPESAARLTGVSTEAVRKWRQSGAVPSRHWAAISAATGLPMDQLR